MEEGRYDLLWENHYSWVTSVKGGKHKAFCKLCQKTFPIGWLWNFPGEIA